MERLEQLVGGFIDAGVHAPVAPQLLEVAVVQEGIYVRVPCVAASEALPRPLM